MSLLTARPSPPSPLPPRAGGEGAGDEQKIADQYALVGEGLRERRHRAGDNATDLGVMGAAGGEEHQLAGRLIVNRRDDGDIGQVRATSIRIVGDEDIARLEARIVFDDPPHGFAHRTEMNRNVRCVHDQLAARRKDAAREVEPLLHVRREARLLQCDPHLLGDRGEQMVEDLNPNGVGGESRVESRESRVSIRSGDFSCPLAPRLGGERVRVRGAFEGRLMAEGRGLRGGRRGCLK